MQTWLGLTVACVLTVAGTAQATGVSDDFEGYAPGSFPGPVWLDAGAFNPLPPVAALPSVTVEVTTDAFGNPTKAMAVSDQLALISGIYQLVPVSRFYTLGAQIRVDRFSNGTASTAADFAPQLTFANARENFYITPQAGIYASSLAQGWRLFLIGESGTGLDLDLGVPVTLGSWYQLALSLDTLDGSYRARIHDAATSTLLVDASGTFPGWVPGVDGLYDAVAFIEGEGSLDSTISNLAYVDNINVTATPAGPVLPLLGLGLAALVARTRRAA